MARRKNAPESIRVKHGLSERLRILRTEFYGERGGPDLARTLGIPVRTWYNYENGVTVPAEIILRVVELTLVEVVWLLRGEGPKFREAVPGPNSIRSEGVAEGLAGSSITTLLRTAIERLEAKERSALDFSIASPMITLRDVESGARDMEKVSTCVNGLINGYLPRDAEDRKYEACQREWLEARRTNRTLRVPDDSMAPIIAEGALISYGEPEPISEAFHDKLVVAESDGKRLVRWYQHCGKFGLLRAENSTANPSSILVELDRDTDLESFHRVIWISTPHP